MSERSAAIRYSIIIVCVTLGWLLSWWISALVAPKTEPDHLRPLKVTVIDDGGAQIRVESTVKPVK